MGDNEGQPGVVYLLGDKFCFQVAAHCGETKWPWWKVLDKGAGGGVNLNFDIPISGHEPSR